MHLSILGVGYEPASDYARYARAVEEAGFDTFFVADERFFLEPFQLLALGAAATGRVGLGPCIIDPYSMHPAMAARAIATLDQISGGRAVLVLGAGKSGFREMGIDRVRSAARLREAVTLIKTLFAKGEADYQGEIIQFHSGRLNLTVRPDLPVWVASEGKLTLEMAGSLADAVMVSSTATPERLAWAVSCVERGASAAGRPRPPVHARLDVAVAEDGNAARDTLRFVVLRHLIANLDKPEFVDEHKLDQAFIADLRALDYRGYSRDGERVKKHAHMVPDRLLTPFVLAGTPAEVRAQAEALGSAVEGITLFPYPVGEQDWINSLNVLAEALGRTNPQP